MAKTDPMIYEPVRTCPKEFNLREWEECRKANFDHLKAIEEKAIANGSLLHRFMYETVADGKAIYQIVKVYKKTVKVRLCNISGSDYEDYVVPQWGEEASIPISYATSSISWQDMWRNRRKEIEEQRDN